MRNALIGLSLLPLIACGTVQPSLPANTDEIDNQVSAGLEMPSDDNPVVLGQNGVMLLWCADADGGCYGTAALVFAGTTPSFPMNWDPSQSPLAFGTYTDNASGQTAFVTQFPYPSSGRGDAAEPDAVNVDWETGDGSDLGEAGINDGWFNLYEGSENVEWVSDCGHYHLNILFGWDGDGNVDVPTNAASYGEDYCAE